MEHSDAYERRKRIHKIASFATLPLFATELVLGQSIYANPSTGAVRSEATTVEDIIREVSASRISERGATRGDDRFSETSMEDRKREGYF